MPSRSKILVSDFDGTMTERDFFQVALSHLPPDAASLWGQYEQGRLSHFKALAGIFARLRVEEPDFEAMVTEMGLESGLAAAALRLKQAGWSLVIASAGCASYIERCLARIGLDAVIHANPGEFSPGQGLVMSHPEASPFFSVETGIDKAAVVRHCLAKALETAFAGDGRPDLAAALLVPPERRFARGWLAEELERQGERFVRFNRWGDIAGDLSGDQP